ncbi:MAG: iron-containing alcohol dehydrogenase [Desulfohalobiaceae bacterium]
MQTEYLQQLRKFAVPEIIFGPGALELAGRQCRNLGASNVLIVTGPKVREMGLSKRVENSLIREGMSYEVFDGLTQNPKDYEVAAGAKFCREQRCDLILAVGGGSPMDCAKGISVVVGNEQNVLEFEGVDEIPKPGVPLICVPTTAGSSADISQFAIVNDSTRKVKISIVSKMVIPELTLVDPETTRTMPPQLTAHTGMDALSHAFEAYVSTLSSPLTDMAAKETVRLVARNLPESCEQPENMELRHNMMLASLMSGLAFSNASLGLVHALAHSLGGRLGLPHGQCNALLLEGVVRFNSSVAAGRYAELGRIMGLSEEGVPSEEELQSLLQGLALLRHRLGISKRLRELGVRQEDIPTLAQNALQDACMATNPRQASLGEVENVLWEIY